MATRRNVLLALGAGAVAAPLAAFSQSQQRVWQIGFLAADSPSTRLYDSFRQGMRGQGYVEGKTCIMEARFADGRSDRLPVLAQELLRAKVDVIVAGGVPRGAAGEKENTRG